MKTFAAPTAPDNYLHSAEHTTWYNETPAGVVCANVLYFLNSPRNTVHNLDVTLLCILFMVRVVTSFHDVTGRVMSGFLILTQSTETAIMLIHYAV